MTGDGSIKLPVEVDDKAAQKELNQLAKDIAGLEAKISKGTAQKSAIAVQLQDARAKADEARRAIEELNAVMRANAAERRQAGDSISAADLAAYKQSTADITRAREAQNKILAAQEKIISDLEVKEKVIAGEITQQTAELERQRGKYDEVNLRLAQQSARQWPRVRQAARSAMDGVSTSLNKGIRALLRYGLGIRSVFILIRRLRTVLIEGIKDFASYDAETKQNIDDLKTAVSGLKGAFVGAFAPLGNMVIPYLVQFIGWITRALEAVSMFIAVLQGKNTYKRAISGMSGVASATGAAASAAKEAQKNFSGLDELNIWQDADSSGGGGGGGSSGSGSGMAWEDVPVEMDSFTTDLALTFKDVFFNWDNVSAEGWLQKIVTGLGALAGGIIGFSVGGVKGAAIGAVVGAGLGLALATVLFTGDRKLDGKEILNAMVLGLSSIALGAIGFAVGGPKGAAIGIAASAGITLGVNAIEVTDKTVLGGIKNSIIQIIENAKAQVENFFNGNVFDWLKQELKAEWEGIMTDLENWWNNTAWGKFINSINAGTYSLFHPGQENPYLIEAPDPSQAGTSQFGRNDITVGSVLQDWLQDLFGVERKTQYGMWKELVDAGYSGTLAGMSDDELKALYDSYFGARSDRKASPVIVSGGGGGDGALKSIVRSRMTIPVTASVDDIEDNVPQSNRFLSNFKSIFTTWVDNYKTSPFSNVLGIFQNWSKPNGGGGGVFASAWSYVTGLFNSFGKNADGSASGLSGVWAYMKALFNSHGFASVWRIPNGWMHALFNSSGFASSWKKPSAYMTAYFNEAYAKLSGVWKKVTGKAAGGVFAGGRWNPIQAYASGGYVGGQLFVAREAGPELVGTLRGHTAVMNNDQIVASVSAGVARAISNLEFHMPAMAMGTVVPPAMMQTATDVSAIKDSIDRLAALLGGGGNNQYQFTAQINRRTLFDEFMDEAKLRQAQTGRNPFVFA